MLLLYIYHLAEQIFCSINFLFSNTWLHFILRAIIFKSRGLSRENVLRIRDFTYMYMYIVPCFKSSQFDLILRKTGTYKMGGYVLVNWLL